MIVKAICIVLLIGIVVLVGMIFRTKKSVDVKPRPQIPKRCRCLDPDIVPLMKGAGGDSVMICRLCGKAVVSTKISKEKS